MVCCARAALLSLPTGDDFVREAARLDWRGSPRGMMNVAPVERYGAEVLPWLAEHLQPGGTLTNIPWCVLPCLFASLSGHHAPLRYATRMW
jgi:hypothetical protein